MQRISDALALTDTDLDREPGSGQGVPSDLGRVRRAARKDKDARFTALLHHVDIDRLRSAYWALKPKAAPGVDGVTWHEYGQDLSLRCGAPFLLRTGLSRRFLHHASPSR